NKFTFFTKLVFDKIIFTFDNNDTLEIIKKEKRIELILNENDKRPVSFIYPSKEMDREMKDFLPSRMIEDFTPRFIRRVGADRWLNELSGERLTTEEILEKYNNEFPEHILERINGKIPKELSRFLKAMSVYFIQEQRLILRQPISDHRMREEIVITDSIEKYSKELSKLIKQKIGEYAQITQSLDNSFPKRLFGQNSNSFSIEELKVKLTALQTKRQKISEYGLLKLDDDSSLLASERIDESEKKALSLYIADNETKLSVFDALVQKIELFTQILNERRFTFKSIEIDKEQGFIFKTKKGDILKLTELSSGEQHEVVLLFELLFNVKENSLVLIDEPEISLHVVWQKAFLRDIEEIIKLQKIDIVIATHSPFIIDERWDLTVNLEESEIVK
ncbi:MAG: AAA family ATPase, partial [Sulfuricurvum sp.]|uniref:AAA family ATPase n=1 Tax=Sulfuricurvum sp. TaxID=2025608 RepID=UPI0025F4FAC7